MPSNLDLIEITRPDLLGGLLRNRRKEMGVTQEQATRRKIGSSKRQSIQRHTQTRCVKALKRLKETP